jgi:hypothetical protein
MYTRAMTRQKFEVWHSVAGLIALVFVQVVLVRAVPFAGLIVLAGALAGALGLLYVSMEVIEEVRSSRHMLVLLSFVLLEFVVFFAGEYGILGLFSSQSFPTLPLDLTSLLLHSVMVFVFNPLYLPADVLGRSLLLIHTGGALGLVLFILQNVWQFRKL